MKTNEELREYRSENLIPPGFTFHIFVSQEGKDTARHTHNFIEIIYIFDGSATQVVNNTSFEVGRGDLIFMNYGCTHAFSPHGNVSFYNICFRPEIEASPASGDAFSALQIAAFEDLRHGNDMGKISFRGSQRDEMESLLKLMHGEYHGKTPFKRAVLESYMSILLVRTLREALPAPESPAPKQDWKELSDYIDANLGTDLTLSALSQRYFYNPSYFSRVFKKQFGASLTDYIGRRRIALAIRLLRETKLSVEEIARRVGYPSKTSFYRAFAKITDSTPTAYRNR